MSQRSFSRRDFVQQSSLAAAALAASPHLLKADTGNATAESAVKDLYHSLSEVQRSKICFPWDHVDKNRGLLRIRVSANWMITDDGINSDFYTPDQQAMIRTAFERMLSPEWVAKFDTQMEDDCGGFGQDQAIAIFGEPGSGKFEFVLTGRHMTLRCDGDSADHVAFGGPIFYGHAPIDDEDPDHDGNVFWQQAIEANQIYQMLDGKQRKLAEVAKSPGESRVGFRGSDLPDLGIPITELSPDQREQMQKTLKSLVSPFRDADQQEALRCLETQGGIDACRLSFFTDNDIGEDKVWDNWRLEGPSFVWHFRGAPHVHVWVNVADNPSVPLNA